MGERYPYPTPDFDERLPAPLDPSAEWDRDNSWREEGFELKAEIEQAGGPVIEIAGPTQSGYEALGQEAMLPEKPMFTNAQFELEHIDRKLDAVMDGTNLPLIDNSVGVLLISALSYVNEVGGRAPDDYDDLQPAIDEYSSYTEPVFGSKRDNLRISTIEEAARVLKPGGILVWQSTHEGDEDVAKINGLVPKQRLHATYETLHKGNIEKVNAENTTIFQKPKLGLTAIEA